MKYQEIFEAMLRGEIIHWRSREYTVVFGDPSKKDGELLIRCNSDTYCAGIAIDNNGEMIHYSPDDFYVDISPEDTADIGRMTPRLLNL